MKIAVVLSSLLFGLSQVGAQPEGEVPSLHGRVLAADGQTPITWVRLALEPLEGPEGERAGQQQDILVMDAGGQFLFDNPPTGRCRLSLYGRYVTFEGWWDQPPPFATCEVVIQPDEPTERVWELRDVPGLLGRLVEADGTTPVAFQTLQLAQAWSPEEPPKRVRRLNDARVAQTDEEGRFAFLQPPQALCCLSALLGSHFVLPLQEVTWPRTETTPLVVSLPPFSAVSGEIFTPQGEPLGDRVFTVHFQRTPDPFFAWDLSYTDCADQRGGYRDLRVPPGRYMAWIIVPGQGHGFGGPFEAQDGQPVTDLDFHLQPNALLRGHVQTVDGEPVPHFPFSLHRQPGEGEPKVVGLLAETDEEGCFALDDLPAGVYRINKGTVDFEMISELDFTLGPGEQQSSLTITVKRCLSPE
jgi:hypothetical protein